MEAWQGDGWGEGWREDPLWACIFRCNVSRFLLLVGAHLGRHWLYSSILTQASSGRPEPRGFWERSAGNYCRLCFRNVQPHALWCS